MYQNPAKAGLCWRNQKLVGWSQTEEVFHGGAAEEVGSRSLARSAHAANSIPHVVYGIIYT